jgi:NifB/MoaA-like Fe-S oxidoreductase
MAAVAGERIVHDEVGGPDDLRVGDHPRTVLEHDHEIGLDDVVIGELHVHRGVEDKPEAGQLHLGIELVLQPL